MTIYQMRKQALTEALESYREYPAGSAKRTLIDRLLEVSRSSAGNNETEKQYHNLIVLRYITDTRQSVQRICKALHIGRQRENFEAVTANAIDRLLVLAYGVDGIDWE